MPKISGLPAAVSSQLTDIVPAVQAGVTYKETLQQILTLFNANISIAQSQVTGLVTALAGKLVAANNLSDLTNAATARANLGVSAVFTWNDVTTTSATMAANNGYVADNASLVTLTLPTTAALGSLIYVQGKGTGGWTIAQPTGVQTSVGSSLTTSGASGSISSTNQGDSILLVCVTANVLWAALTAPQGILTIV